MQTKSWAFYEKNKIQFGPFSTLFGTVQLPKIPPQVFMAA
jgi:hypothetical protein